MRVSAAILLAMATVSVANTLPEKAAPALRIALPNGKKLSLRQTSEVCLPTQNEQNCEGECIPEDWDCCHDGESGACEDGYYCDGDGCCPVGRLCEGEPTGCTKSFKECGGSCIPKEGICCLDFWCEKGSTCGKNDCVDPSGHTLGVSSLTAEGSATATGSHANSTKGAATSTSSSRGSTSATSTSRAGSSAGATVTQTSLVSGAKPTDTQHGGKDHGSAGMSLQAPLALVGSVVVALFL